MRISSMVMALLGASKLDRQDLAPVLGIAASGVGRSISGKRKWTPDDVDLMAEFFSARLGEQIDPGLFYREAGTLFGSQNRKQNIGADLRLLDGEGAEVEPGPGQMSLPFPKLQLVK